MNGSSSRASIVPGPAPKSRRRTAPCPSGHQRRTPKRKTRNERRLVPKLRLGTHVREALLPVEWPVQNCPLWHGLLTVPRVSTEGLHCPCKARETFGRAVWHGQETVPQRASGERLGCCDAKPGS